MENSEFKLYCVGSNSFFRSIVDCIEGLIDRLCVITSLNFDAKRVVGGACFS